MITKTADGKFIQVTATAGELYKEDRDAGIWRAAYETLWHEYDEYWRSLNPNHAPRPMVPLERCREQHGDE